jgi:uncharacterized alpha-E superfamily protein
MPLLSRVAESLFWLGRYIERAESTARLLDVTYHGRLEPGSADMEGARNTWEALVQTLGLESSYSARGFAWGEEPVVSFLTVDRENPSSIISALTLARENARSVRDYLSSELWIAINRLYHATARGNVHLIMADGLYDFCDSVRHGAQLFHGAAESTALHDEGWHWLRCGVFLERADMVTRIIDSKYHLLMSSLDEVGGAVDRFQWAAVLRSVSGYEAFRRTHAGGIEPQAVAEFLLLHPQFPRSLRGSVDGLLQALDAATEGADLRPRNSAMRLVTRLQARLQYESIDLLIAAGLHEFLGETRAELAGVTAAVSNAFFWSTSSAA